MPGGGCALGSARKNQLPPHCLMLAKKSLPTVPFLSDDVLCSSCLASGDGGYLDPTDVSGRPSPSPAPGLPYWPMSLNYSEILAYANEPQVRRDGL